MDDREYVTGPTASDGDVAAGPLAGLERTIIDSLDEGVYYVDRARRIRYWNAGAERLTGFRSVDVVGHFCYDNILNHVDEAGRPMCRTMCPLAATMGDGSPREANVFLRHHGGHRVSVKVRTSPIRDREERVIGAVEIFDDSADLASVRREASELRALAMHDALTGLPNRRHYEMAIASRIAELAGYGRQFGLLVVDVDHFKTINDRHGHATGDIALQTIAKTLLQASRSLDAVARYGGEEFVMTIMDVDESSLCQIADRLRILIERSRVRLDNLDIGITVSIGATMALPGESADIIFTRADAALYAAKKAGRNRVVCH